MVYSTPCQCALAIRGSSYVVCCNRVFTIILSRHASRFETRRPDRRRPSVQFHCRCLGFISRPRLDAAIWGAELAVGNGRERIYVIEPTGPIMNDPNLTDKKFPGNPTLSYRSRDPLRVIAEVTKWQGHSPEGLQQVKENVARANVEATNIID